jgi:hypothetical protein
VTIPPGGGPNPGFDPYDYTGEGTRNAGNQGNGETRPLIHSVYDYDGSGRPGDGRPNGDRPQMVNMGPMHFTSPDGREVFNIQNAYFPEGFNFSRAFGGDMAQNGQDQRWGGYNPFDNPQYQGRNPMVNQEAAQLAAREMQNYYLQQQEQQMLNSQLYSQNGPMPNFYASHYHRHGIPSYYHHRGGPEYGAPNPFYSGYYPGAGQQQPMIAFNIGGGRRGRGAGFEIAI